MVEAHNGSLLQSKAPCGVGSNTHTKDGYEMDTEFVFLEMCRHLRSSIQSYTPNTHAQVGSQVSRLSAMVGARLLQS